jgi:FeS assembly SUF system regulator
MIRISKLADYGIVLLTEFARDPENVVYNAKDLSAAAMLPLPTVSKLLKVLSRAELLVSSRGMKGGYRLARPPERISVAEIIGAVEGRVALTQCSEELRSCNREPICPLRSNWLRINQVVFEALSGLRLSQMVRPLPRVWGLRSASRPQAEHAPASPGA